MLQELKARESQLIIYYENVMRECKYGEQEKRDYNPQFSRRLFNICSIYGWSDRQGLYNLRLDNEQRAYEKGHMFTDEYFERQLENIREILWERPGHLCRSRRLTTADPTFAGPIWTGSGFMSGGQGVRLCMDWQANSAPFGLIIKQKPFSFIDS